MGFEIERKFLVKALPENPERFPYHEITQGYLCRGPAVRVRRETDVRPGDSGEPAENYYMTYKGLRTAGALAQEEYNLPLTKQAYEHLVRKADGTVITKRRYVIDLREAAGLDGGAGPGNGDAAATSADPALEEWIASGEACVELDVFEGDLKGLVIAEVEFPSEALARSWQPLSWLGAEVTDDRRYSNASLSENGPASIGL